jgi:hypothetical protein
MHLVAGGAVESLYTPILKGRGGEFEALAHLARSTAAKITPLLEAVPKAQTLDLDTTDFVRKLRDHWPLGETVFIDLNYFVGSSDQPSRWEKLLTEALVAPRRSWEQPLGCTTSPNVDLRFWTT